MDSRAAALLRAGVPLSLLLDLAEAAGPDSREILRVEGVLADVEAERKLIEALTRYEALR
ncbi:MAG: hypothetical protein QOE64_771, partial [Frankiales bacterium]|nr:hypothetical protein [Frankiales bacterium]